MERIWGLYRAPGMLNHWVSTLLAAQRGRIWCFPSLGMLPTEEKFQQPGAVSVQPLGFFQKTTGTEFSSSQRLAWLARSLPAFQQRSPGRFLPSCCKKSQPCLTPNIPKNPEGSVGNVALMAVSHPKGTHLARDKPQVCPQVIPALHKAPGTPHSSSPAIPALREASGASPRLRMLRRDARLWETDKVAAITFSLENNVPTQPASGI